MVANAGRDADGHDVRGCDDGSLRVENDASQRARRGILATGAGRDKDELKEEQANDNKPKNVANRSQKWLSALEHGNPLVSKTSESEGIPETLSIYIPKCVLPECDTRTQNMFSFDDPAQRRGRMSECADT
jgi:hypothetical protein